MTDAQIRYLQQKENARHNYEQEKVSAAQLAETKRSNAAQESLHKYATDVSAANAKLAAEATRYAAEQRAEGTMYSSDQSLQGTKYASDQSLQGTRYSADTNSSASRYRTDVESADRAARLEFDKDTQAIRNRIEQRRVWIEQVDKFSSATLRKAQINKIFADMSRDVTQLQLAADRLGLDQEAAQFQNGLKKAETDLAYAKAGKTQLESIDIIRSWITGIANFFKIGGPWNKGE